MTKIIGFISYLIMLGIVTPCPSLVTQGLLCLHAISQNEEYEGIIDIVSVDCFSMELVVEKPKVQSVFLSKASV